MKKKLTGLFIIMMMFMFVFGAGRVISYASGSSGTASASDSTASAKVKNGLIRSSKGYLYNYVNGVRKNGWQTIKGTFLRDVQLYLLVLHTVLRGLSVPLCIVFTGKPVCDRRIRAGNKCIPWLCTAVSFKCKMDL